MKISVVSPIYNEEDCVRELCRLLLDVLPQLNCDYEIVLVDDGSVDSSWKTICELSQANPGVRGVRFSRNFGHHCAISAGIHHAEGDWIVVMDSDLQDPPSAIPELLDKALGRLRYRARPPPAAKIRVVQKFLFPNVLPDVSLSHWQQI